LKQFLTVKIHTNGLKREWYTEQVFRKDGIFPFSFQNLRKTALGPKFKVDSSK
jgi:hypothetical protein